MTDGCGLINLFGLRRLRDQFALNDSPTAVQVRLGPAKVEPYPPIILQIAHDHSKGLVILHPHDAENEETTPHAFIRPSQRKIQYPTDEGLDPTLRIIEVIRFSHMRSPARLNSEVMINLAENGVPHGVLTQLLRDGLDKQIAGLLSWDGPDAMLNLWCNVSRLGGVMAARMAREAPGEARSKGYADRDNEDAESDDEDELEQPHVSERSTAWWADQISGCPSSLDECVMLLLDSGFTPQNSAVLRAKLKEVVKRTIDNYVVRLKIEVPFSCTAFIIPGTSSVDCWYNKSK